MRYKLERNLARSEIHSYKDAIVVPIPDSGRCAAMGYAWESKIPYMEGLMKNRYLWQLKSDVNEKLNPVKPIVNGKDIILIDDSILSGITIKKIITILRNTGSKSIHMRISSPPIINSCEINSSFSNRELLIAYQEKIKNNKNYVSVIKNYIQADSLKYQSIEGLMDAIGLDENQSCFDCVMDVISTKKEKISQQIELIN